MNAIRTIVQNDLKIYFSQMGNLVGLIILPIAFTLVLGWAFGGGSNDGPVRVRVDVLDEDGTAESAALLEQLRTTNEPLVLCPMDNDADDFCRMGEETLTLELGKERAHDEQTDGFLVIPAGYAQTIENLERTELHFFAAGNPLLPNAVQQTIEAVLQKVNGASTTATVTNALLDGLAKQTGLDALIGPLQPAFVDAVYMDAAARLDARSDAVRYQTTTGEEATESGSGFGQTVPGMGSMYVMFTVLAATNVLLRERTQWTLQRLAALPLTRAQILGGKIVTYFILGMLQFLVIFAVGLVVGLDFGTRPFLLFPIMIAFVLCITALAFAIAPWVKSQGQAGGISLLLALVFAPLGGAWWPLDIVPDFMRTIGHISPVAWAMDAFHDIMWYSGGLADIMPELAVLLGAAVILFGIGVRSFRVA
ncbi:ABC transporter permease [Chloroflexi bacterium TSY]|nr:ABC transporter permease [Chloroflexi bacterium TSY]